MKFFLDVPPLPPSDNPILPLNPIALWLIAVLIGETIGCLCGMYVLKKIKGVSWFESAKAIVPSMFISFVAGMLCYAFTFAFLT